MNRFQTLISISTCAATTGPDDDVIDNTVPTNESIRRQNITLTSCTEIENKDNIRIMSCLETQKIELVLCTHGAILYTNHPRPAEGGAFVARCQVFTLRLLLVANAPSFWTVRRAASHQAGAKLYAYKNSSKTSTYNSTSRSTSSPVFISGHYKYD